jgi:general L-amino acid transport system permease protein
MTVQNDAGADPTPRVSPFYDPRVRGFVFQAALVVFVVASSTWAPRTPSRTCRCQNIASGFGFLEHHRRLRHLADADPLFCDDSTYGDASGRSPQHAARRRRSASSPRPSSASSSASPGCRTNWLIARLATVYVEIIRNIPLLLQLFFWYFGVLKSLPSIRASFGHLAVRTPSSSRSAASTCRSRSSGRAASAGRGIRGLSIGVRRHRRDLPLGAQCAPGVPRASSPPVFWTSVGLILGLPLARLPRRRQLSRDASTCRLPGFNMSAACASEPEFLALLPRHCRSTPPRSSPRSCARASKACQPRPDGGRRRARAAAAADDCASSSCRRRCG